MTILDCNILLNTSSIINYRFKRYSTDQTQPNKNPSLLTRSGRDLTGVCSRFTVGLLVVCSGFTRCLLLVSALRTEVLSRPTRLLSYRLKSLPSVYSKYRWIDNWLFFSSDCSLSTCIFLYFYDKIEDENWMTRIYQYKIPTRPNDKLNPGLLSGFTLG